MKYLLSEQYNTKVRIDLEKNEAFLMHDGSEVKAPTGSKIVADATMNGKEITQKEYNS